MVAVAAAPAAALAARAASGAMPEAAAVKENRHAREGTRAALVAKAAVPTVVAVREGMVEAQGAAGNAALAVDADGAAWGHVLCCLKSDSC